MRRSLLAVLAAAAALAGCGGQTGNASNANNAASNGSSAQADTFRTAVASQCERQMTSMPSPPPGFDARQICNCAIDNALQGRADPKNFIRSPEGQQALMQAMLGCVQRPQGPGAGK